MLRWLAKDERRRKEIGKFANSADGMHRLYWEKLLPVELDHDFHIHHSPELKEVDFVGRPMVLFLGQYSTGKSTFIRHLLGRDYPGVRIGQEPTTDKFVAVMHGNNEQVIPGNAVASDKSLPFTMLQDFGTGFLDHFECARINCPVVEGITLIDTPGILTGDEKRVKRGYDYEAVVRWFADRACMILILFDVAKMDVSDEFTRVLLGTRSHKDKIHFLLNKADRITTPQLMRVYGAMMWNLGKVIDSPEVSRVFVGSFWDEPLANDEQRRLFESEENDLYTQLTWLPKTVVIRRLSDLIKRARTAKVHAYLMEYLKKKVPSAYGRDIQKRRLLEGLPNIYKEIAEEKGLPIGDFPDPRSLRQTLARADFAKFKRVDKAKMQVLETMLEVDLPKMMTVLHVEDGAPGQGGLTAALASPFAVIKVDGLTEASVYMAQWLVPPDPEECRAEFIEAGPNSQGILSAQKAKGKLVESKLPSSILHKIWALADADKDGALTLYEYALAKHFIKMRLDGHDLPQCLPAQLWPADPPLLCTPPPQPRTPSTPSLSTMSSRPLLPLRGFEVVPMQVTV